ncbi:hypothetical protein RSP799_16715 [Ralstonia solanacearum]|nr:hypothetical protein RSP799_16715 [Ralstonia solanacearum]
MKNALPEASTSDSRKRTRPTGRGAAERLAPAAWPDGQRRHTNTRTPPNPPGRTPSGRQAARALNRNGSALALGGGGTIMAGSGRTAALAGVRHLF